MNRRLIAVENAEAVEWARAFFDRLRNSRDPATGHPWLSVEGGRAGAILILKALALSDIRHLMVRIEEAAAGWDLAHEALRELILDYGMRGEVLPVPLQAYQLRIVAGYSPKVKQTQRAHKFFRDYAIAHAVAVVADRFGLDPVGRKAGSANATIAKALRGRGTTMTPNRIEQICIAMKPWLLRLPLGQAFPMLSGKL